MNKAFTLIELLAVIVILAIIALIAVPIILNIIEDTKKSAVIRSAEMYIHGIEINNINNEIKDEESLEGQYNIIEFADIEISGEKPIDGMVEIEEGKIVDYSLQIGNYIVNYDKKQNKPIIGGEIKKAEPNVELIKGMIAVQYKDNNWVVVDSTKRDWYNYSNQEWANAVILNTGVTKNIGDTIDVENEVKAMLVYIPRYEYKIEGAYGKGGTSTSSPGEIEINFVTKRVTKGSVGYRVHPGFTFGSEELNGIWVGKFEISAEKGSECYITSSSANCNNSNQEPYVIPNVSSLRVQNLSNFFETSRKFNTYLSGGDSHIIKNSEWAAVAYLSQSKYGKYGNSNYSGTEKEVMINNCSKYITGIGADNQNDNSSSATCETNTYETLKGQAASTTGNITGVYDMSGGSWEFVMGVLSDSNGNPMSGNHATLNSGFSGMLNDGTVYSGKEFPDSKYYDLYTSDDINLACNNGICYGHSLSETKGWYGDNVDFITVSNPWIVRSGTHTNKNLTGMFNFGKASGCESATNSSRIVISKI